MKILNIIQTYYRFIFWGLVSLIAILFFMYMFFVSTTIRSVVERQVLSEQVVLLRSNMATLESEYINSSHIIDMELALSLGFKKVINPVFISKQKSVSLNSLR